MIYTKKILRREIFPHTFARKFALEVGDFELYDKQNDFVFVRYNELDFLSLYLNQLQDFGWVENEDFSLVTVDNSVRLVIEYGNLMVSYNDVHDFYFLAKPVPEQFDGLVIYFRAPKPIISVTPIRKFYPLSVPEFETVKVQDVTPIRFFDASQEDPGLTLNII